MKRTTISLIGGAAALAAVFGVATVAAPAPPAAPKPLPASAERQPVQRTTLMCPAPAPNDYDSSVYTAYTPPALHPGGPTGGTAALTPVDQTDGVGDTIATPSAHAKPVTPLTVPGKPVVTDGAKTPYPVIGSADGALAPGWSAQMTTTIDAGTGMGLLGTACAQAGTDFWIPGASLASSRQDYVHLTNPDSQAATVDVSLYDAKGAVKLSGNTGLTVPARSSVPVLLSTLLSGDTAGDVTLHVQARDGRVAAEVQAMSKTTGSDWIPPSATPTTSAVLPGIPKDATSVRLIGYATGGNDADVKVQLLTPAGPITPAGHETIDLKSGVTTSVDLPKLTQGQVGSLVLSPAPDSGQAAPFVAALQVVRGHGGNEEMGYIPATDPVGARSTIDDNRSTSGSTLALAAPDGDATVKVTSSQPSKGGSPATTTVTVKKGTTLQVTPPAPTGSGTFALTVVPVSGAPVYACRELTASDGDGLPDFTLQTMPDDGGYVAVPQAAQDLTVAAP
ncbi:DUF5719 family protein [Streptomyces sp. SL13]|uniref:DUF5719 family protein n=1 Tax=Streptantibioticus silvisoli TaxID=2705255 RepID=A0AA90H410_9ACTN|nr:DUF5719 family protein [Streptantibioticus silvisoli]MDI5973014.1 DUF5719 family protein [Streptantibioticus silvisoli]